MQEVSLLVVGAAAVAGVLIGWGAGFVRRRLLGRSLARLAADLDRVCAASDRLEQASGSLDAAAAQQIAGLVDGCKSLERERNTWKEKYYRCAIEYGRAQEMLLQERESLRMQFFAATKRPPKMNAAIDQVTGHFRETYVKTAEKELQAEAQKTGERIPGVESAPTGAASP